MTPCRLDKIRDQVRKSAEIVKTWPAWKQNILINSAKPMRDKPREIIVRNQQ